jgi:benzoate-CoA ligase family protein
MLRPTLEEVRAELEFVEHIIVIGQPSPPPQPLPRIGGGTRGGGIIAWADWLKNEPIVLDRAPTHRDDFCSLNYSSGTTGTPKGILHAHKDYPLTAQLWGVNVLGLREEDRTFGAPKLFFTFGLGGVLIFAWYVGASCVLYPGPPRLATKMLEMIDQFKPTILYHAPTGYAATAAVENFTEQYDLSSLRLCVSAGESLPAPVWQSWKEKTGLDIIDGIGSTENFHIFLSNRPDDIRPGSSGKPFPGYELKIVDEEGRDVSPGEVGNLLVKGESAALFYLHQYECSQQTFRGEWLFTGDKYYVDEDGYYWHAGRSDDMLKVGGIWVSPVEVESTLISHEAVLECAVVGRTDPSNLVKPQAFVVLNEGFDPSDELATALIEHCRTNMAAYKRPRWIEFVEELPKTATGKIQRFRLRQE